MPEVNPRFFLCLIGPWSSAIAPEACLKLPKARRNACKLVNTHCLVPSSWRALMVAKFTIYCQSQVFSELSLFQETVAPVDTK